MKDRTVRVLKWTGITVVMIAVVYAVVLGLANRGLHRAYAALEADGRPMKAEQIIPPRISDSENAALIYQSVVLQLKAESGVETDLFTELGDMASRILEEKPDNEAAEQFMALSERQVVRDSLTALRRASQKPGCRYDLDYSKGAGILLPHVSALRNLSRIVCAKAHMEAEHGNAEVAWGDAITSLRLANALENEPLLISQLVRIAQFGLVADTISFLAARCAPNQQQYGEITELLRGFEDAAPFVLAMDGERVLLGEWAFTLPRSELRKTAEALEAGPAATGVLVPALLQRDHAAYLTIMHAYASNVTDIYSANDEELEEKLLQDIPRYCVLTRMLVPALSAAKARYMSMVARARVTRAGLAALQHLQAEGGFPDHLDALGVVNPIDPFTGKALIYRTTRSGFVVYSVGENLTDDGGTATKDDRSGDIVWDYSAGNK